MLNQNLLLADGGYNLTKSLRFRSSASAYLNRTASSPTNNLKWTWSGWVKKGALSAFGGLIAAGADANNYATLYQYNDNTLFFYQVSGGAVVGQISTTALYRDPAAWYHIVGVYDSANATSANRLLIYVNGVAQTTTVTTALGSSQASFINSAIPQYLGRNGGGANNYFDGYLAETYFIDGQALTPSSFGSTNATTGVWQPAKYNGTYGTNGFYLPFTNTTSTSTLGNDFSGNGNTWTVNNISLTTGSTYDSMTDVPTLTSPTIANYCVMNAASIGSDATISNANLTIAYGTGATIKCTMGTFGMSSGKWYWEITTTASSIASTAAMYGITNGSSASDFPEYPGYNANGWAYYGNTGNKYNNNTATSYGASYGVNDVIGVAFDANAGSLTFYKNNVSQGVAFSGLPAGTYFPAVGDGSIGNTFTAAFNFGQQPFSYTPPSGYVALNTFNLPTSTIVKGNTVMDATIYTSNGGVQTVTNAGSFKPDLVWTKPRSNIGGNIVNDSVRGASLYFTTNTTNAELTDANYLTSFNSNGFSLGSTNFTNGYTIVGWQWQAGQGSTSSNTNGSITSTTSVNATAGFSVATFNAGSSGAQSFGHGLGVAPKMVIIKDRANAVGWNVYHSSVVTATNQYLQLNTTAVVATLSGAWGSALPTSTLVGFGSGTIVTANANCVAYCWAEIAGYSAFGSYTGNGSTDGPFVYTGFRPKFVMIKRTDSSSNGDWRMLDSVRDPYNVSQNVLYANLSLAEDTGTPIEDFLSNGFKLRTTINGYNNSGGTYIYMAFAENPFKNALAR